VGVGFGLGSGVDTGTGLRFGVGLGVGFVPGSIFTCASARSGRSVSTLNPAPINSSAQTVITVAFIAFGLPPAASM
jgi:hypothetical protein